MRSAWHQSIFPALITITYGQTHAAGHTVIPPSPLPTHSIREKAGQSLCILPSSPISQPPSTSNCPGFPPVELCHFMPQTGKPTTTTSLPPMLSRSHKHKVPELALKKLVQNKRLPLPPARRQREATPRSDWPPSPPGSGWTGCSPHLPPTHPDLA